MTLDKNDAVAVRRRKLEHELQIPLSAISEGAIDEFVASTRHCENMIGVTQVPLGIAGPIVYQTIKSSKKHSAYIPLATTEGALVASVNRGCKAIAQSGGAIVDSYSVGATRGPVFYVGSLAENDRLSIFLDTHLAAMQKIAAFTSNHITLTKIFSRGVGQYRYVRFQYDTKDAMGLNMVTIATEAIARYIQEQTHISCVALSGNYCTDKKPSWMNFIEGRGAKVWAEVVLTEEVLQETLKTTAQKFYDVWISKCMLGSVMSGSMGNNAQFANVLAAVFLATGQDIAHVGECSIGVTTAEVRKKELYMSVYMPDLMVGTVGGGTGLGAQKEALQILGCYGEKNKNKFVEILGASVLAGEISLLASLSEGSLARAHQKLARGKQL
ncbi:MAG: hydroxymethylglutaryl-CoA reductase [Microgenomates group bacterium]